MLAESLAPASVFTQAPGSSTTSSGILPWSLLVILVVASAVVVPVFASLLRRRLPETRREAIPLEPVVFGDSPQARRSPRHAVLLHRTLMTTVFLAVLSLVVLTGIAALRTLGVAGLQVAIALALPTLLVALHARQRNRKR